MRNFGMLMVVAVFVIGLSAQSALAVPAFDKFFKKTYVDGNENAAFVDATKEAKCNVCHHGKTKKNRNDYGKALSTLLKKDDYKTERVKAEPDVVDKELKEAFEKVEKMKSVSGETFGDLIKAGKLPGTAPSE